MKKNKKNSNVKFVAVPVKKKTLVRKVSRPKTDRILIDNFVQLQKVLTHLSENFDNLSKRIDKMLNLFEDSAKSVVQKEFYPIDEKAKAEINKKMDMLIDQNKIIAKGLTLMHESAKNPEINYSIGINPEHNYSSFQNSTPVQKYIDPVKESKPFPKSTNDPEPFKNF